MKEFKQRCCPTSVKYPHMKDATKPMSFHVTAQDVMGSRCRSWTECAGANAIKRETGAETVWVKRTITVLAFPNGNITRYRNPMMLTRAIEQYDVTGGYFPEGMYRLYPIKESQKMGRSHEKNAKRTHSQSRGIYVPHKRPVVALR